MDKEKLALVCVGGIAVDEYILHSLKKSKFPIGEYEKVIAIPTDEIFDKRTPGIIKWIPIFNKFYDKFISDLHGFFDDEEGRKRACRLVRNEVIKLQADGYKVSILSHSLGTIIALCSGPNESGRKPIIVDAFYSYNSPIGFGIYPLGILVRSFVRKFLSNFKAHRYEHIYSSKDIVSKVYNAAITRIIDEVRIEPKLKLDTGMGHSLVDNLNERYGTEL